MNIMEAIKSGKRIRSESANYGWTANDYKFWNREAVLADDWEVEVEEQRINLTISGRNTKSTQVSIPQSDGQVMWYITVNLDI